VFVRAKAQSKMTVYGDAAPQTWPGPAPVAANTASERKTFMEKYGSTQTEWSAQDLSEWLLPRRFLAVSKLETANLHELSHVKAGCV